MSLNHLYPTNHKWKLYGTQHHHIISNNFDFKKSHYSLRAMELIPSTQTFHKVCLSIALGLLGLVALQLNPVVARHSPTDHPLDHKKNNSTNLWFFFQYAKLIYNVLFKVNPWLMLSSHFRNPLTLNQRFARWKWPRTVIWILMITSAHKSDMQTADFLFV